MVLGYKKTFEKDLELKIKITKDSFLIKLDGKIEIDIKRNKDIEK